MTSVRKISKIWKGKPTIEGAGVHLKRAFGNYRFPRLDGITQVSLRFYYC